MPPRRPSPAEAVTFIYPQEPPIADADALEDLLAGYRRQGRVVLLHFWSIENAASRDQFGAFIDLYRDNRAYGLQCVAAAFDGSGQWTTEISPFLRSVGCNYPCVIVPFSSRGDVVARMAYEWNGRIPAALVFDRDGRLVAELPAGTSVDKIRQVVADVVAGRLEASEGAARPSSKRVTAQSRALDLSVNKTIARARSEADSAGDVDRMAQSIAARCEATIDWSTAKVAILPFTLVGSGGTPEMGRQLADSVARILAARHPEAIVPRDQADAVLKRYNLTPLAVEYDPTTVTGRVGWTHIITGTLNMK
ncbi:MAG: hypothetical protein JXQ73_21380 [Phycisphaerae bacterium]|nr:hypothetical protein [Phycisphaerae bacterium]